MLAIVIRKRLRAELKQLRRKYDIFSPSIQDVFEPQEISKLFDNKVDPTFFKDLLEDLILALHQITGKKVILLIDEYDATLFSANENKYWKEAVNFFGSLFCRTVSKIKIFFLKGVITSILKVAKESIFSGMNNLDICTILSYKFRADFGFTKNEVRKLAELTNQTQNLGIIKK